MPLNNGFKQSELGLIPDDWIIRKFVDVTHVITCGVAATPKYVSESVGKPFLSAQNVSNQKVVYNKYKCISIELFDQITKHNKPERGDLLYTRVGAGIGEAGVIEDDFSFAIYVSLTLIKINKKWLDNYYLLYVLNSPRYRFLAKNAQFAGGGVQNLNVQVVRDFPIIVPPLDEQRAIATVLSDIDALLVAQDKLIVKKRGIKQAAMQELLKGDKRLPGFTGKWEVGNLKAIISPLKKTRRLSSAGKNEGIYPFFTNTTKPVDKFLDEIDFDTEAIIANTGGEAYFNYYNGKFTAMSDCFVFETNLETRYVYYFLKNIEGKVNDTGFTGSGIKHLDKKLFYKIQLTFPASLQEQSAIADVLSDMDAEVSALEKQRDKIKAIKQGMLYQLLNGRIRLI